MKVTILGAGRRGLRLAKHLTEEKKDVVIIDINPACAQKAMSSVDCIAYTASGTDADALMQAQISDSDAFIAVTGSDETNIVSCSLVSSLFNIPLTIASVKNLAYTKTNSISGVTHVINPYQEVARRIYLDIDRGIYSDNISFENSSFVLYNVYVEKNSKYAGKLIKNIRRSIPGNYIIAALVRNGQAIVPDGDTTVLPGDTLSLSVGEDDVEAILSSVGRRRIKTNKVAIVGSTIVTDFILKRFTARQQKKVTVIAKDPVACQTLAEKYPQALVLNANITEEGIFQQEELEKYDLMVCATDNDELNIIASSYAKNIGVVSTMALINKNPEFMRMANHMDIDSIISAQDVTVDSIMRYLHGTNISSVHTLFDGKLEAMEIKLEANSPLVNKALSDISMKGKGIIAGICRDEKTIIPNGTFVLKENDVLILVFQRENLNFIQDLLCIQSK